MTAQNLIKMLMDAGLSQAEIARRTGISQPTINRIYTGRLLGSRLQTYEALKALSRSVHRAARAKKSVPEHVSE